jgi:hypothetical protein
MSIAFASFRSPCPVIATTGPLVTNKLVPLVLVPRDK